MLFICSPSKILTNHDNFFIQVVPWGDEEALLNHLRELDADILISGHTHDQVASKIDKKFILNPGSMTGAYSPLKR